MKIPVEPLMVEYAQAVSPRLKLEVTRTVHYLMELGMLHELGAQCASFEPEDVSSQLLIVAEGRTWSSVARDIAELEGVEAPSIATRCVVEGMKTHSEHVVRSLGGMREFLQEAVARIRADLPAEEGGLE